MSNKSKKLLSNAKEWAVNIGASLGILIGGIATAAAAIAALVGVVVGGVFALGSYKEWAENPNSLPSSEGVITDLQERGPSIVTGELNNHFTFVANGIKTSQDLKDFQAKNERVRIYYQKNDQFPASNISSTDNTGLTTYNPDFKAPANLVFKVEDGRIAYQGENSTQKGLIKTLKHESDGAVSGTLTNGFNFYANNKEVVETMDAAANSGQKVELQYETADHRPAGSAGSEVKAPTNIVYDVMFG